MSTGERGAARTGGFLSLDQLRDGMCEQYAVRRGKATIVVDLVFDGHAFVVSERITEPGVESASTSTSHGLLGPAHREFERLTRKHKNRPINLG